VQGSALRRVDSVDVGSVVEEDLDDGGETLGGGLVQGRRATVVLDVDVAGRVDHQSGHDLGPSHESGLVQGTQALIVRARVDVETIDKVLILALVLTTTSTRRGGVERRRGRGGVGAKGEREDVGEDLEVAREHGLVEDREAETVRDFERGALLEEKTGEGSVATLDSPVERGETEVVLGVDVSVVLDEKTGSLKVVVEDSVVQAGASHTLLVHVLTSVEELLDAHHVSETSCLHEALGLVVGDLSSSSDGGEDGLELALLGDGARGRSSRGRTSTLETGGGGRGEGCRRSSSRRLLLVAYEAHGVFCFQLLLLFREFVGGVASGGGAMGFLSFLFLFFFQQIKK